MSCKVSPLSRKALRRRGHIAKHPWAVHPCKGAVVLQLALLLGLTTHKPGSLDGSLGRTLLLYYDQRNIRSSISSVFEYIWRGKGANICRLHLLFGHFCFSPVFLEDYLTSCNKATFQLETHLFTWTEICFNTSSSFLKLLPFCILICFWCRWLVCFAMTSKMVWSISSILSAKRSDIKASLVQSKLCPDPAFVQWVCFARTLQVHVANLCHISYFIAIYTSAQLPTS